MWENLAHFAIAWSHQNLVFEQRLHFHHRSASHIFHTLRGGLVFLLCAIVRQPGLRLCGSHGSGSGIVGSLCLVALLLGHHTLFIEIFDTLIRFVSNFLCGFGLLHHAVSTTLDFFASAFSTFCAVEAATRCAL